MCVIGLVGALAAVAGGGAPAAPAATCPDGVDAGSFASAERLLALNRKMDSFGRRPTASRAHERFIDWIERQMRAIPGVRVKSLRYGIDRWLERRSRVSVGRERLPDSGAVPYAQVTSRRGVAGRLVYVPGGTAIDAADVEGKIVVRDVATGSIPGAAFNVLAWGFWDPDLTLVPYQLQDYERDYLGAGDRVADLRAAARGRAAGLVFVHGFPRRQVRGHYSPYDGHGWKVPAIYVGADEGERLKQLAADGRRARVRIGAQRKRAPTRTLIARLPGRSRVRTVVQSHTDGMNAIWDNGPPAMVRLAEYFAGLPRECRPRTIEFVFTTAHLYQSRGGSERYAKRLDRAYDRGTLALVTAIEHLGAKEYGALPRRDGGPGRELVPTGLSEPTGIFTGQSPVLVAQTLAAVIDRDVRRTLILRGADLPSVSLPPHHSFGGEGTSYHNHLIPTVALVAGPWSLYNPAFGMEAIDGELMRSQTLVFADLIHSTATVPRELLAGGYLGERAARELLCGADDEGFGLVECDP
jgi:hypothetical protein